MVEEVAGVGVPWVVVAWECQIAALTWEGGQLCPHLHLSELADSVRCQSAKIKDFRSTQEKLNDVHSHSFNKNLRNADPSKIKLGTGGGPVCTAAITTAQTKARTDKRGKPQLLFRGTKRTRAVS